MKNHVYIFVLLLPLTFSCTLFKTSTEPLLIINDEINGLENQNVEIEFTKGKGFNHPTFVIWLEDMEGNYIKTLYVTQSYATGIFTYGTLTDSTWQRTSGKSTQPAALPYWAHKKGLINNVTLIPTPEHPFVDAYTSASPKTSFQYNTSVAKHDKIRVLVEINQPWDWNLHWTNDKIDNEWYRHSAQPSIIYAVALTGAKRYDLNPIGYGNPTGETGELFTQLKTLTSAKQIFKEINLRIK